MKIIYLFICFQQNCLFSFKKNAVLRAVDRKNTNKIYKSIIQNIHNVHFVLSAE